MTQTHEETQAKTLAKSLNLDVEAGRLLFSWHVFISFKEGPTPRLMTGPAGTQSEAWSDALTVLKALDEREERAFDEGTLWVR